MICGFCSLTPTAPNPQGSDNIISHVVLLLLSLQFFIIVSIHFLNGSAKCYSNGLVHVLHSFPVTKTLNHTAVQCDCVSVVRTEQRGSWELAPHHLLQFEFFTCCCLFCQCVWAADGRGGQQHAVVGVAVWEEQGECVSVSVWSGCWQQGLTSWKWCSVISVTALWRICPREIRHTWNTWQMCMLCMWDNVWYKYLCVYSLWMFSLWRTSRVMSLFTHGVIHLSWVHCFDKFRNTEK